MSNSKLKTFNVKKSLKLQAKKRKLEAFLNLVREDEKACTDEGKKPGTTFKESYKALKDELQKYKKKKEVNPLFYLTDDGKAAQVKYSINKEYKLCSNSPLFIEDVYYLLMKCVLGNLSPFPLRWGKLEQANNVSKTVLIECEGLSEQSVKEMNLVFKEKFQLSYVVEVVSTDTPFASELSTLHLASDFYSEAKRNYSSMFPINQTSVIKPEEIIQKNNLSKLHLLLSPIQLAMEQYPLPQSIFEQSKSDGYCFTKDSYTPVHADSPMFAVDCEMCRTVSGKQEVTRIAIVNEDLETVYHELVKPKAEIVDYITRFSGITEEMLRNVKTTLKDVQKDIQNILPSDSILCGQSLNCDLHSLKMIHPYCIDTSVIFNEYGIRQKKTSLKQLARIHLKESIQDGKRGHNPIEDSIATMKLVQLKLKKSVNYGDAVLCPNTDEDNINNFGKKNDSTLSTVGETSQFSNCESLHSDYKEGGFFSRISKGLKKVCLIGNENSLKNYYQEMITDNVTKIMKSKLKKTMKAIAGNLENNDLIISHLVLDEENDSVMELKDEMKQIYDCLPSKTMFIILMSGVGEQSNSSFRHSFCMVTCKK